MKKEALFFKETTWQFQLLWLCFLGGSYIQEIYPITRWAHDKHLPFNQNKNLLLFFFNKREKEKKKRISFWPLSVALKIVQLMLKFFQSFLKRVESETCFC